MRQVGGFLRVITSSSTNKTDRHAKAEILLKVALNITTLTLYFGDFMWMHHCVRLYKCKRANQGTSYMKRNFAKKQNAFKTYCIFICCEMLKYLEQSVKIPKGGNLKP